KDKMIHSVKMATQFIRMLPVEESPEHTEGYEGFYHLFSMEGTTEKTEAYYIIRDFDKEGFLARKDKVRESVTQLQAKYGEDKILLEINDQYYNMKEKIEPVFEIVETAKKAMNKLNIEPIIEPIRGGTDGSQLSYMGLPTPNIFTGGENFHGKHE